MINPAQYQQVLQKMPDPQLMQLLKRPDKIPSQFVIQEINRRKQMRQAEEARKKQVANAVAMQQQPVQTTTPEGQPAMGMQFGGPPRSTGGRIYTGGFNRNVIRDQLRDLGYVPKNVQEDERITNFGRFTGPEIKSILDRDFIATGVRSPKGGFEYVQKPNISTVNVRDFLEENQEPNLTPPPVNVYEEDTYEMEPGTTGIKSVKQKDDVATDSGYDIVTNLDGKNSATSFFAKEIEEANNKIQDTKSQFNAQQTLKGIDELSLFKPLEAAYKNLSDQGKKDVEEYNKESQKLLDARKELIEKLEKQKRSPESIVYESLIQTGLSLMASPEANFTQALGQAGQTGFATFQNLRKEQKDLVKDLYKESFNLAKEEFDHKMKAQEIRSKYDLADIKGKTAIFESKLAERGANREDINLLSGIDFKNQELNLTRQKLELAKIDSQINAFRADTAAIVAENQAMFQKGSLDVKFAELKEPANIFETVLRESDNFDEAVKKYSEYFVDRSSDKKTDAELRLKLVEKVVPEMLKNIDQLRIGEEGYMEAYLLEIDKVINNLNLFAITGGITIDEDDA